MEPLRFALRAMGASLVLAMLVSGCRGSDDKPQPPGNSTLGADPAQLQNRLDPARTARILNDATIPQSQRALVSDGVLTFPEYESAILEMAGCVRTAGGELGPGEPRLNRRGLYTYSVSWPIDGPPGTESEVRHCIDQNLSLISLLWSEVVVVPETELRSAMQAMRECLAGAGVEGGGDLSSPEDFHNFIRSKAAAGTLTSQLQNTYLACARGVEDNWGIAGFAPAT